MSPVNRKDTVSTNGGAADSVVVRFAGDSGDGMQLAGTQFASTSAIFGNDISTLPDFPAEIRAPAGTVPGVSGYQINFGNTRVFTPGDQVQALIAMNAAAFKAHIEDVTPGGIVIVNDSEFERQNLRKANYPDDYDPLEDPAYQEKYRIYRVPISRLNREALADTGLGVKAANRCKNMYALGLIYWLYERPLDNTIGFLEDYFSKQKNLPEVADANIRALKAGYYFGETAELFTARYKVGRALLPPGRYRNLTGNDALAMGLVTASTLANKTTIYCSYPITPASDILHAIAGLRHFGVKTFQAEDEIAAVTAAIGAAFAGQIGVCGTSGPGMVLKQEAINLAVMTELPLVIVDVQRGGPSTGLPTKTEQTDLLLALFGRNGESPVVVLAPQSPGDCFTIAVEAVRIALTHMTPVVVLSEGYLATSAEPWRIPDPNSFAPIEVHHPEHAGDGAPFLPYARDERFVRPWAIPGSPGLEHRIGGLEKEENTGNVSYDASNHQRMTELRQEKVDAVADSIPPLEVDGDREGDLLVLGWGGSYGAILKATRRVQARGHAVASAHLRHLNPMPKNLGEVLSRYGQVLIPELNSGQLRMLIRAKFLVDAKGLNKVAGKPFLVDEIEQAIEAMLANGPKAANTPVLDDEVVGQVDPEGQVDQESLDGKPAAGEPAASALSSS
jgi:2-oxoglutarate ferredoxin oxidoreductase subunit alpha